LLVGLKRGKLNQGKTDIATTDHDRLRGVQWGLSDVGNWTDYQVDVKANGGGNYADGDYADAGDLDQDRKHNKANEIYDETAGNAITEEEGQVAWARPARDARGNMTTVTRPSSPTGTYVCYHDPWNRPTWLACGDFFVVYRYDGLHRQICKLVARVGNVFDRTDYYHTAGWQVVEERLAEDVSDWDALYNPNPTAATEPKYQYVWSLRYIDAAVLRDENTDPETDDLCDDDRLYYCNDVNMNVMALVDDSGAVQERYVYNAYGEVTIYDNDWSDEVDWDDGEHNEILYCGYRWEQKSGLYHVRYRMYHPTLGRWLQRDPLAYVDGMNLQLYVGNAPLGAVDPWGADDKQLSNEQIAELIYDAKFGDIPSGEWGDAMKKLDDQGAEKITNVGVMGAQIVGTLWVGEIAIDQPRANADARSLVNQLGLAEWSTRWDLVNGFRIYYTTEGTEILPEPRHLNGVDRGGKLLGKIRDGCPDTFLGLELVRQARFDRTWDSPVLEGKEVERIVGLVNENEDAVYIVNNRTYYRRHCAGWKCKQEHRISVRTLGYTCEYAYPEWLKKLLGENSLVVDMPQWTAVHVQRRLTCRPAQWISVRWGPKMGQQP